MPFSVVTSKKAQQDLLNIKARHSDILTGMINQKVMVDAHNQQKAAEKQNQDIMQREMQQAQMANDTTVQKNTMDFQTKQQELDIKKTALMQP